MATEKNTSTTTATIAITPLPGAGTRKGVDELDPADKDGFIATWFTALTSLKSNSDFDDFMSFFRLAAIHGAPYVGWDGESSDGPYPHTNGNFCVHGLNTFPTWHRVYMALFETALYNQIPDNDPNKATFRMPYWDWAKNDEGAFTTPLPALLASQYWPPSSSGDPDKENPLWRFVNPKTINTGDDDVPLPFGDVTMYPYTLPNDYPTNWSTTSSTSRCADPTSQEFATGDNRMDKLMANLQTPEWYRASKSNDPLPYASIADYVYLLFSWKYPDFDSFATTDADPVPDPVSGGPFYGWTSLEYLHNNLHNFIGGSDSTQYGHMADVAVAGFDPIFYVHHCFIDALFAAWQGLHPDLWLDNDSASGPLRPFHTDTNGTLFNSNNVKSISDWNYAYSQFPTSKPSDPEALQKELRITINRRYGNGMQHIVGQAKKDGIAGYRNDYVINVLYNRHALDSSYKIQFFLGPIPKNMADKHSAKHPHHIGSIYTFSNSGRARCANCIKQESIKQLSRAQIILTVPLIHRQRKQLLGHLNPGGHDGVQEYLKKNLTWKIVDKAGNDVPIEGNDRMADFKVILVQGEADHYPEDETRLSDFHNDTYETFWQGNVPGHESDPPEHYVLKRP